MAQRSSTLARYLFLAYALLLAYASLHPFSGWRDPGLTPLAFLAAPLPRYLTAFDLASNFFGYAPLGFLAVLALYPRLAWPWAVAVASLLALALSLSLESLQLFLPSRIPSNVDVLTNTAGGTAGALLASLTARRLVQGGVLQALRYRLFLPGARIDLGLVLLGLWLLSQLNPETLLFGSGDLRELFQSPSGQLHPADMFVRVEASVAGANTIAVGMFISCLVQRAQPMRLLFLGLLAAALLIRTVAFGVLVSPHEMLVWLTPGALHGVAVGLVAVLLGVALPRSARLALAALALMAATALVNLAPENPYLAASLALWRQGHFLNFNGLTRLVSSFWPFAAMFYLMLLSGELGRQRT
jgi:VanZ family protein